jgi:hypothetical protein
MDDFFNQKLDEISQMDEKNVGKFGLVTNLRPRFKNLEKNEK